MKEVTKSNYCVHINFTTQLQNAQMFNELKMINEKKIVSFMFKQNMYAI